MAEKKTTAKTAPAPAVETVENPVNKMIDGLVEKAQAALFEIVLDLYSDCTLHCIGAYHLFYFCVQKAYAGSKYRGNGTHEPGLHYLY